MDVIPRLFICMAESHVSIRYRGFMGSSAGVQAVLLTERN